MGGYAAEQKIITVCGDIQWMNIDSPRDPLHSVVCAVFRRIVTVSFGIW